MEVLTRPMLACLKWLTGSLANKKHLKQMLKCSIESSQSSLLFVSYIFLFSAAS